MKPGWRHGMHNKDGGRQATSNTCELPTSVMSRSEQSPQHKHTTLSHTLRDDYFRSSRYIPSSFISKTPKHKHPFHRTQHCIQIQSTIDRVVRNMYDSFMEHVSYHDTTSAVLERGLRSDRLPSLSRTLWRGGWRVAGGMGGRGVEKHGQPRT